MMKAAMSNFRQVDRETGFLMPPSVDEWLPERHLARFVVDVIDRLDLSAMVKAYRGSGSASSRSTSMVDMMPNPGARTSELIHESVFEIPVTLRRTQAANVPAFVVFVSFSWVNLNVIVNVEDLVFSFTVVSKLLPTFSVRSRGIAIGGTKTADWLVIGFRYS